jgi:diamine N-acetyltransferase
MQIASADPAEIPVIEKLAHDIWPKVYQNILSPQQLIYMLKMIYSPTALLHQMINEDHHFIIVKDDDGPVGFADYSSKHKSEPSIFRLNKIYVLQNRQGEGFGKTLMQYVTETALLAGAKKLELNVNRFNKPALNYYIKYGFIIQCEADIDIGEGYFMNDYEMSKDL